MNNRKDAPKYNAKIAKKYLDTAKKMSGKEGKLAHAIYKVFNNYTKSYGSYESFEQGTFYDAYKDLCGINPAEAATFNEFWNNEFAKVVEGLMGQKDAKTIKDACALVFESPFTSAYYRPSYRSKHAGDYVEKFVRVIARAITSKCYGEISIEEAFQGGNPHIFDSEFQALEIRNGNSVINEMVAEAIQGDSSDISFSYSIIRGIIKSGVPEYIEMLGKLLLAAKGQEGIRQSILESADHGTLEAHLYFIRLVIEHKLARFSSVIRAFATWTGLAFDNEKPAVIEKCMKLAHMYLSDEAKFAVGLQSDDVLEIYMALWACACRDIHAASAAANSLLDSPQKYQRLVAWYFIHGSVNEKVKHETAIAYIQERDPEELAWICSCLHGSSEALRYKWDRRERKAAYPDRVFPKSTEARREQFNKLVEVMDYIGNKKTTFSGSVFPWAFAQLDNANVSKCLIGLVGYDCNADMIEELAVLIPQMDVDSRLSYYINVLDPTNATQRQLLLGGLSDKSVHTKQDVVEVLGKQTLTSTDIDYLTKALTSTSAGLRKSVMTLLQEQPAPLIRQGLTALLDSSNNKQLLAGVELLDIFSEKSPEIRAEYSEKVTQLETRESLPKDVQVILQRFNPKEAENEKTSENGFGLFDPSAVIFDVKTQKEKRANITVHSKNELVKLLAVSDGDLKKLIVPIKEIIEKNKGMECEISNNIGGKYKVILGDNPYWLPMLPDKKREPANIRIYSIYAEDDYDTESGGIYDYYLGKEIIDAVIKSKVSPVTIAKIVCNTGLYDNISLKKEPELKALLEGLTHGKKLKLTEFAGDYGNMIENILNAVLVTYNQGVFDFAMEAWVSLVELAPKDKILLKYEKKNQWDYSYNGPDGKICVFDQDIFAAWRTRVRQFAKTDEQFTAFWREQWYQYLLTDRKFMPSFLHGFMRALGLGLVCGDGLYHELLMGANASDYIRSLKSEYAWSRDLQKKAQELCPFIIEYLDNVVDCIVTLEKKRGELQTPLSHLATDIGYFKGGTDHFVGLLAALGKDTFERGYGWGATKRSSICSLMKNCHPKPEDTPQEFSEAIKAAKIPQKRLLQAVMYAPQWADMAEKATGIKGLASAVWLFHAHINERFDAEKETKVALYSSVSQQQFADGTFDKDWFLEAYGAVGANIFDELYKNAKYITSSNSSHRRSQLYADAILGRLNKSTVQKEVMEKRGQEKLRAYGLIPLDKKKPGDALARYEFIQKFAKESKQFGAQRKASESKAVNIALENLALTTGFGDADRMGWYLESEKMDGLRHLMQPKVINEAKAAASAGNTESAYCVWLEIAEDGTPSVGVSSGGKALKSIPKALAKNETVLEIQAAVKDLKEQKKRARVGFEMAMVSRTVFRAEEFIRLLNHPVLRGMIASLVVVSGDNIGFPALLQISQGDGKASAMDDKSSLDGRIGLFLVTPDGEKHQLSTNKVVSTNETQDVASTSKTQEVASTNKTHAGDTLTIAHPHDLIKYNCWSEYQRHLYKNQIIQPFKQVFREYYPMTEDERFEGSISRRYAGHQVQPAKTVALLKTRGWTADYYEGLQRVYHKENLIARMYAMADWFSPSDIEAPTLETVRFYSRDKNEPLAFENVPPVIFSETMRDIDLIVSVAHVGGVDPQASHSTVEMRVAIARELLELLAVTNVSFQTTHAHITGSMGDYTVHMGSGVVHQTSVGMLSVLPVHSQARGRIFLPFADDDPRTAEVMSKILLFADDKKIKDPAILAQMNSTK